jgi:broad specificity phosphatase PhoE
VKTIYLIRHGETRANREGVFRGRLDLPLSERGCEQARRLGAWFADKTVEKILVSPLQRAVQTAELGFPGRELTRDGRINNLDLGLWSGRSKQEIRDQEPRLWRRWVRSPETMTFPGGERLADVQARCRKFLAALRRGPTEGAVAVVSHRTVLKVMLAEALGLKEHYFWRFHLDNASVTTLLYEKERGFILYQSNRTGHLDGTVFESY